MFVCVFVHEKESESDNRHVEVRPPTDEDPYFRNNMGQFASPELYVSKDTTSNTQPYAGSMTAALSHAIQGGNVYSPSVAPQATQQNVASNNNVAADTSKVVTSTDDVASGSRVGVATDAGVATAPSEVETNHKAKAAIDAKEYEELLSMKAQFAELIEMQKKNQEESEGLKRKLRDWEQIGSTLGGSNNPEASKKILEKLNNDKIKSLIEKVDEIMPELEKEYREASPAEKEHMKQYLNALKSYQLDNDLLKNPKELSGAEGLVTILTKASRRNNTRFSQAEASRKAAEIKYKKQLEAEKMKNEKLLKEFELLNQSGTRETIKPTILPSVPHSSSTDFSNDQRNAKMRKVSTAASASSGESQSYYSRPSQDTVMPQLSGFTYDDLYSGRVDPSHMTGGLANVRTTASASSSGNSIQDIEHMRQQKLYETQMKAKRITVHSGKQTAEINVKPWDLSTGKYTALGDAYVGNQWYDWVGHQIKRNKENLRGSDVFVKAENTVPTGFNFDGRTWTRS